MNGIVAIIKPPGMTSHDVVSFIRKCTGIRRVGHTGTLDPGAVGVLPICIGKATKVADLITSQQKQYRAELKLGIITDTQDSDGKVLDIRKVNVSKDALVNVIESFKGRIEQVPPMYSAVKVKGQKLYELARKGIEIKREPRQIEIKDIRIIDIDDKNDTVLFDVTCSKGTYIRTLCFDIGKKLGCGAHMSFLLRTKSGMFDMEKSITLEQFKQRIENESINSILIPVDKIFEHHPQVVVTPIIEKKVLNGMQIPLNAIESKEHLKEGIQCRIYNAKGDFLCLSQIVKKPDHILYLKMVKSFF
jgi:tRNA pseudouridine55 synthase